MSVESKASELAKAYQPKDFEDRIYRDWLAGGEGRRGEHERHRLASKFTFTKRAPSCEDALRIDQAARSGGDLVNMRAVGLALADRDRARLHGLRNLAH